MSEHPTPLALEQLSVGDLSGATQEATARHVLGCALCQAFLDELEAARKTTMPPERFVAQVAERRNRTARSRRRRRLGAALLVLAAAALLLLIPRPGLRLKGAGVTVHRLRDGEVRVVAAGDTIRAGDGLRVVLTLAHPATAAAWFVDANGRVDRFDGPVALPAGERPLPGSAVVEAPCLDLLLVVAIDASLSEAQLRSPPPGTMTRRLRCE